MKKIDTRNFDLNLRKAKFNSKFNAVNCLGYKKLFEPFGNINN